MPNEQERKFKCTRCGQEVVAEMPPGDIINKPTWSGLIMVHQAVAVCAGCGQTFAFVLRGIKGMEFGWMEVQVKGPEQSNIILPGDTPIDISQFKKPV